MTAKIPVTVLGATGTVGQKFIRLLAEHPWFEVAAVAASSASAGKRYGEVVRWREGVAIPEHHRHHRELPGQRVSRGRGPEGA
jgi:aspartate-semialdehyde dehydrogenase